MDKEEKVIVFTQMVLRIWGPEKGSGTVRKCTSVDQNKDTRDEPWVTTEVVTSTRAQREGSPWVLVFVRESWGNGVVFFPTKERTKNKPHRPVSALETGVRNTTMVNWQPGVSEPAPRRRVFPLPMGWKGSCTLGILGVHNEVKEVDNPNDCGPVPSKHDMVHDG